MAKQKTFRQIKRQVRFFLHRWHRRLGLLAILFVSLLSVTGILLNHPQFFSLTQSYPQSSWLLKPYESTLPAISQGYQAQNGLWFYQQAGNLYADQQTLLPCQNLSAAVALSQSWFFVCSSQWWWLDSDLQVLDSFNPSDFLMNSTSSGDSSTIELLTFSTDNHAEQVLLQINSRWHALDFDNLSLSNIDSDGSDVIWSAKPLAKQYQMRNQHIHYQRLLLDMHSGRWFAYWLGDMAVWWVDFIALLLILLGLSGGWIWWSRR